MTWVCKYCNTCNEDSVEYCIVCDEPKATAAMPVEPPPAPSRRRKSSSGTSSSTTSRKRRSTTVRSSSSTSRSSTRTSSSSSSSSPAGTYSRSTTPTPTVSTPTRTSAATTTPASTDTPSSKAFSKSLALIIALLFELMLIVNIVFGATLYEWSSWTLYAQTALFLLFYGVAIFLLNKKILRFVFPIINAVLLFFSALSYTIVGHDAAILYLSLIGASLFTTVFHLIAGKMQCDSRTEKSGFKTAALLSQLLFGILALLFYFFGGEITYTAICFVSGVCITALVLSALFAVISYSFVSYWGYQMSEDALFAARFTLAALQILFAVFVIFYGQIGDPLRTISFFAFGTLSIAAIAIMIYENKNRIAESLFSVLTNLFAALSMMAFVFFNDFTFGRGIDLYQQAMLGIVFASAIVHLIASVEVKITSEDYRNKYMFIPFAVLGLSILNAFLFFFLKDRYVGLSTVLSAYLLIPLFPVMRYTKRDPSLHKLNVLLFIGLLISIICSLIISFTNISSDMSLGLWSSMLALLFIFLFACFDAYVPSTKGLVGPIAWIIYSIVELVLTLTLKEKIARFALIFAFAAIISSIVTIEQNKTKAKGVRKLSFPVLFYNLVFAIVDLALFIV